MMGFLIGLVILLFALGAWWGWMLRRSRPFVMPPMRKRVFPARGSDPANHEDAPADIPRIIWTYWHSPNLPLVVQRCIDNWQRHNPDYQVHVLNADTLQRYLGDVPDGLHRLGLPKQSDWVRLALLHRYGGIWLDASTILTQSLDWVMQRQREHAADFVGFYLDGYTSLEEYPVIESWFMAAAPASPFISDWLRVFSDAAVLGQTDAYLSKLRDAGMYARMTQKIGDPAYHTIHVAAQNVLQGSGGEPEPVRHRLYLQCAEDSAYVFQAHAGWKRRPLFVYLLWNDAPRDVVALIKLRGGERRNLEPYLRHGIFRRQSLVARELAAH